MCGSNEGILKMSVNPYTLNRLYNNGIIDYVDTSVCNLSMPTYAPMNGSQYLDMARTGSLYNTYPTDTFLQNNNTESENKPQNNKFWEDDVLNIKTTFNNSEHSKMVKKGLITTGILGLTLLCLFSGKKKPPVQKQGFFSRIFHRKKC